MDGRGADGRRHVSPRRRHAPAQPAPATVRCARAGATCMQWMQAEAGAGASAMSADRAGCPSLLACRLAELVDAAEARDAEVEELGKAARQVGCGVGREAGVLRRYRRDSLVGRPPAAAPDPSSPLPARPPSCLRPAAQGRPPRPARFGRPDERADGAAAVGAAAGRAGRGGPSCGAWPCMQSHFTRRKP